MLQPQSHRRGSKQPRYLNSASLRMQGKEWRVRTGNSGWELWLVAVPCTSTTPWVPPFILHTVWGGSDCCFSCRRMKASKAHRDALTCPGLAGTGKAGQLLGAAPGWITLRLQALPPLLSTLPHSRSQASLPCSSSQISTPGFGPCLSSHLRNGGSDAVALPTLLLWVGLGLAGKNRSAGRQMQA